MTQSGPASASGGRARAAAVGVRDVSKSFGVVQALRDIRLDFKAGTLTSLLGPSGCGKTTLLRLIAGLESPTSGEIEINGRAVAQVPIHRRNIGLVFQNYALFPHKTVGENIAFGLKHRGVPRHESAEKVRKVLEVVRLPGIEHRYPNQLSGGQQQRVALARAVVFEPDVLLLDEPLSALDANLRAEMRVEIKLIQKALGLTTILVTHDQQEALAMSDEIVVMDQGVVQQVGDPATVYRHPRNRFVAGFLGHANTLACEVLEPVAGTPGQWRVRLNNGAVLRGVAGGPPPQQQPRPGEAADLVIRLSDIHLEPPGQGEAPDANGFPAVVIDSSYLGDDAQLLLDADGLQVSATRRVGGSAPQGAMIGAGTAVRVGIPPEACAILPVEGATKRSR